MFKIMKERYNPEIRERILVVVSDESIVHLSEIARKSGTMRSTARKHLERLQREGVVKELRRGNLRLFMLKEAE